MMVTCQCWHVFESVLVCWRTPGSTDSLSAAAVLLHCCSSAAPVARVACLGPGPRTTRWQKKIKTIENKMYVSDKFRTEDQSLIVLLPCPFNQY